jgi:predicted phosphodiesterase
MVKKALIIFISCLFFYGCNMFDFFSTPSLDERLGEKDNFKFLTAVDRNPSFGSAYSFIVISDIHIDEGDTRGAEKIKGVIDGNPAIKFIVFLGDLTNNGARQDMEAFLAIANSISVPVYPVIGNHDLFEGSNWAVWKEKIGSTRYRINGDTATLFVLDSANSYVGKEQMDWLERELQSAIGRVFVFTHENFFATEPFSVENTMQTNERARMVNILNNRCDMMFMGHIHKRAVNSAGSVTYISVDCFRDTKNYLMVNVSPIDINFEFRKL